MRKLAILLLALCAIAGPSAARHRKPHKVARRADGRIKRYRAPKQKRIRRTTYQTPARSPIGPTPERFQEIQRALAAKGYYTGELNGQWTPESTSALRRFQADQNLRVDGKIGSLSLIALGLGPKRSPNTQSTLNTQSAPLAAPAASFKPAPAEELPPVTVPE